MLGSTIEIRKILGTISILGYFDGIYTRKAFIRINPGFYMVTGFMHDINTGIQNNNKALLKLA